MTPTQTTDHSCVCPCIDLLKYWTFYIGLKKHCQVLKRFPQIV